MLKVDLFYKRNQTEREEPQLHMVILKINVYYDHIWDRILEDIKKKTFILILKTKEFNLK